MLGRKNKNRFTEERAIRVKRIRTRYGTYYDVLISLPRPWVERLLRELGAESFEELKGKKLRIEYNGNIVIKPVHGS